MKNRALIPVFAATLFTSAFLIFSVQPMVSKMLLPLLGGGPSVWNTAMVFFQAMLLAGYGYAHFIAKHLSLRAQALVHIALLLVFAYVLPLGFPAGAEPPGNEGQEWWQLSLMLASIGGPFFILAASAPMFQHWFSASGHEDAENPYFLYAVSNAGSIISLLSYPILIEPFIGITAQTNVWAWGYGVLIALTAASAFMVRGGKKPVPVYEGTDYGVTALDRAKWIFLSFIPSSLMLGVTTLMTTDLASAPFLWILPLSLYLLTFIVAFSTKPFINVQMARILVPYLLACCILAFMLMSFATIQYLMIALSLTTFYFCAQLCHGELAESKPQSSHLTEFYLLLSLGGVLGGIFNALIAPRIFIQPIEYALVLGMMGFVIWAEYAKMPKITLAFNTIHDRQKIKKLLLVDGLTIAYVLGAFAFIMLVKNQTVQILGTLGIFCLLVMTVQNRFAFAVVTFIALLIFQPGTWGNNNTLLAMDRNYFGSLKITEVNNVHYLYHGTTVHGAQNQDEKYKLTPLTYYSPGSPTSDAFKVLNKRQGPQKIGVIGLGVGSVACYPKQGRHFDFFEIDQAVVKMAQNPEYFSFLKDCKSPYDIILGDGRVKIAEKPDGYYDMIYLDAFSSDNIPTHLLTREALEMYKSKLKEHGLLVIHISNRFTDLQPPLYSTLSLLDQSVFFKFHRPDQVKGEISEIYVPSIFAVTAHEKEDIAIFAEKYGWAPLADDRKARPWTDDYANILSNLFIWK